MQERLKQIDSGAIFFRAPALLLHNQATAPSFQKINNSAPLFRIAKFSVISFFKVDLPFCEYGGIFDRFLTARAALAIYSFNQFQVMLCEELLKDVLRLLHAEKYRRPVLSRRALL